MAVLTEPERAALMRWSEDFMTRHPNALPYQNMTVHDGRAALDATDDHIETDIAAFVADLPEPFKTESGDALKAFVYWVVATAKVSPYITGDMEFAKRVLGGID